MDKGLKTTLIVLSIQVLITVMAVMAMLTLSDTLTALSALAGGLISIITTAFFGARMFWGLKVIPAQQVISRLYSGLVQKFLLTIMLFVVAMKWFDVEFLALISIYIATLSAFWFVLLIRV